jgi:NAD(P)-dependent dehydrogenase (short-subunit alcohol dehydrogenase family)
MNQRRVAPVTGVGPGLGASLARRFARGGFAVGLAARRSTFIDDLAREIANGGGNAIALVADVSRPAEVRSAVERVSEA